MTDTEKTQSWGRVSWTRRIIGLLVAGVVVVGSGCFSLLVLLGFPGKFALSFAAVLGFEVICLLWLGMLLQDNVRQNIAEARFQPERSQRRAWILWGAGATVFLLDRWLMPVGIWYRTVALVVAASLVLYGMFSWMVGRLLEAEISGRLRYGFAERWLPRIPAWMVVGFGLVVMLLFDFLGGIFWWYRTYVTPTQRAAVSQRIQMLRSIQLTTLSDRHQQDLGLYEKTESDWSRHYNDPNILSWRISRVIAEAEGQVHKPSWWWRYLPDGERLRCEPFSIEAFLRVPYYLVKQRRKVGGSTPALQAAKNVLDFGQKRQGVGLLSTVRQKLFEEMPRSYVMCQAFSPEEMMAIYQSIVWAGVGANYGLHRLALYYFGKDDPTSLSWNEAVVAAASLPNPGRLNPWYIESCRKGKCENSAKARVYEVWLSRIHQIKARLRSQGIRVESELPVFQNGMSKLKAISHRWKHHDVHIRQWTAKMMPESVKDWKHGTRIELFYDRQLLTGLSGKTGLSDAVKETLQSYREQLDELQLSFTLLDAKTGKMAAQYGGDGHNDMALARKPVVGSMFKVITSLVGDVWPDELPLINHGKASPHRRRFLYHPTRQQKGHLVRNSHAMPPYVNKTEALTISANIGFVFFSLRWTWFLPPMEWMKILSIGLQQLYVDVLKLPPDKAQEKVTEVVRDPVLLRRELVKHFGYKPYLQDMREQAIFEAAKAATIQSLITNKDIKKDQLTDLLDLERTDSTTSMDETIKKAFETQKEAHSKRFHTGDTSLEMLSWTRELRMEMGLRYLIHLAETIAGYQRKEDHLAPVMTLTLGVNDTQTHQVAAVAAFLAAKQLRRVALIHRVSRGNQTLYEHRDAVLPTSISEKSLEHTRVAMRSVLEKGTAKGAGAFLKKKYGESILALSGAKTGTVQKTRGISCLGFVEHRAGAVTLSTPTNEVLKSFRIRRSLQRRKETHDKQYRRWMEKYEEASPGSRLARRYRTLALQHQAKLVALEKTLQEAQQVGKQYHQLRKTYKAHQEQAMSAQKRGKEAGLRIRRSQASIARWTRQLPKYQKFLEQYQKRLSPLWQPDGQVRPPKTRQEIHNMQRYQHWENQIEIARSLIKEAQDVIQKEKQIQSDKTKEHESGMEKYRQVLQQFRDLSGAFHKTHEPWSLSSAKACNMLFVLLSHWKDWEEKVQPPPATQQVPQSPQVSTPGPQVVSQVPKTGEQSPQIAPQSPQAASQAPQAMPVRPLEPMVRPVIPAVSGVPVGTTVPGIRETTSRPVVPVVRQIPPSAAVRQEPPIVRTETLPPPPEIRGSH